MSSSWATAFSAAAAIVLLTTPLFRRLARSVGLFDEPSAGKIHAVPVPYLGGLAIALGTLAGILASPAQGLRVGALALVAAGIGALGLLDDDHHLRPGTRLAGETVAAVATLALGLRFQVTGIWLADGALTVVWIVGLTNAVNLLDNMDGLAAGVAASMAGSSLFLVLGTDAQPVAPLAAAVVGACLAFLAYNKRPASVYMGDAGSLFLGYLVAVISLAVTQPLPAGPRLFVPLMLAAVPLVDTTTVVISRLRRGVSPMQAGTDHLSHRLVRLGLAPGPAVAALGTSSLAIGILGSLVGRAAPGGPVPHSTIPDLLYPPGVALVPVAAAFAVLGVVLLVVLRHRSMADPTPFPTDRLTRVKERSVR
jgi:UDP-GlcNAc:undecaprenyl-phosphate GlcNAc-1-phosphate transferase